LGPPPHHSSSNTVIESGVTGPGMPPNVELPTTSLLLIDSNANDRAFYADGLKRCSPDYLILEATDGRSGLDLCRSRRIDCVVLELALPDQSGFALLADLLPIPSRPNVAVIVLTTLAYRGMWELARQNGAHACLVKRYTSGEYLDKAIQCAVALVGLISKEDRHRPI
jgi:DNA-binding NarL/FixJ family response regulator